MNQEHYVIPWWNTEPSFKMEILSEGIRLRGAIATKRGEAAEARLFNEVYATIVQNEGHIFETDHRLVRSCRELGVNRRELDSKLRQLFEELNGTVGTTMAAEMMWLPPRQVRRLIEKEELVAIKAYRWYIYYMDVLRLTATRLGIKV
jgi:hypothetical protein